MDNLENNLQRIWAVVRNADQSKPVAGNNPVPTYKTPIESVIRSEVNSPVAPMQRFISKFRFWRSF